MTTLEDRQTIADNIYEAHTRVLGLRLLVKLQALAYGHCSVGLMT